MREQLNEEIFFLMYHLKLSANLALSLTAWERQWIIDRFITERGNNGEAK